MARATSCTRSTSEGVISSPATATIPIDERASMWSPAMPANTRSTAPPAISSASRSACRIASVVASRLVTVSPRMPLVRAWPTPRILSARVRPSPFSSPMTAQVFVVPMSRPAIRFAVIPFLVRASIGGLLEVAAPPDHHLVGEAQVEERGQRSAAPRYVVQHGHRLVESRLRERRPEAQPHRGLPPLDGHVARAFLGDLGDLLPEGRVLLGQPRGLARRR